MNDSICTISFTYRWMIFKFMKNRSNHYLNSKSNMNDIICTFFVAWGNIVIYRIFEKLNISENNWARWNIIRKIAL